MKSLSAKVGVILAIGLSIFSYAEASGADIILLPPIYGTAIVALMTQKEIAVAADSGGTGEGGALTDKLICKIKQIDNVYVAVHGLIEYRPSGGSGGFDLWSIVSSAVRGNQKISVKADSFQSLLKPNLESAIILMKIYDFTDYNRYFPIFEPKRPLVGAIFFGVEDGHLVMSHRGFTANTNDQFVRQLESNKVDYVGTSCSAPCYIFVSDDNKEENDEFEKVHLHIPLKESLTDIARKFVQRAIDGNSDEFNPPIDIISITKDGAKWIQRKEECQEIKE